MSGTYKVSLGQSDLTINGFNGKFKQRNCMQSRTDLSWVTAKCSITIVESLFSPLYNKVSKTFLIRFIASTANRTIQCGKRVMNCVRIVSGL